MGTAVETMTVPTKEAARIIGYQTDGEIVQQCRTNFIDCVSGAFGYRVPMSELFRFGDAQAYRRQWVEYRKRGHKKIENPPTVLEIDPETFNVTIYGLLTSAHQSMEALEILLHAVDELRTKVNRLCSELGVRE
jgi:hypothetical protein